MTAPAVEALKTALGPLASAPAFTAGGSVPPRVDPGPIKGAAEGVLAIRDTGLPPFLRAAVWASSLGIARKASPTDIPPPPSTRPPDSEAEAIHADVLETAPEVVAFTSRPVQIELESLLTHFCSTRSVPYLPGLNDIAAPFIALSGPACVDSWSETVEGNDFTSNPVPELPLGFKFSAFYKFQSKFLPSLFDEDSDVLDGTLAAFRLLLLYHAPDLANALDRARLAPDTYATPWFLTLFATIAPIPALTPLWDRLILLGDTTLPSFIAVALLMESQDVLVASADSPSVLLDMLSSLSISSPAVATSLAASAATLAAATPESFMSLLRDPTSSDLSAALALPIQPSELLSSTKYFLVDCRPKEALEAGRAPTSYHLDPAAMTDDPVAFAEELAQFEPMKGRPLAFLGDDSPGFAPLVLHFLSKESFPHVSVVQGGYAALHDALVAAGRVRQAGVASGAGGSGSGAGVPGAQGGVVPLVAPTTSLAAFATSSGSKLSKWRSKVTAAGSKLGASINKKITATVGGGSAASGSSTPSSAFGTSVAAATTYNFSGVGATPPPDNEVDLDSSIRSDRPDPPVRSESRTSVASTKSNLSTGSGGSSRAAAARAAGMKKVASLKKLAGGFKSMLRDGSSSKKTESNAQVNGAAGKKSKKDNQPSAGTTASAASSVVPSATFSIDDDDDVVAPMGSSAIVPLYVAPWESDPDIYLASATSVADGKSIRLAVTTDEVLALAMDTDKPGWATVQSRLPLQRLYRITFKKKNLRRVTLHWKLQKGVDAITALVYDLDSPQDLTAAVKERLDALNNPSEPETASPTEIADLMGGPMDGTDPFGGEAETPLQPLSSTTQSPAVANLLSLDETETEPQLIPSLDESAAVGDVGEGLDINASGGTGLEEMEGLEAALAASDGRDDSGNSTGAADDDLQAQIADLLSEV